MFSTTCHLCNVSTGCFMGKRPVLPRKFWLRQAVEKPIAGPQVRCLPVSCKGSKKLTPSAQIQQMQRKMKGMSTHFLGAQKNKKFSNQKKNSWKKQKSKIKQKNCQMPFFWHLFFSLGVFFLASSIYISRVAATKLMDWQYPILGFLAAKANSRCSNAFSSTSTSAQKKNYKKWSILDLDLEKIEKDDQDRNP